MFSYDNIILQTNRQNSLHEKETDKKKCELSFEHRKLFYNCQFVCYLRGDYKISLH